jgi:hypothetical protein
MLPSTAVARGDHFPKGSGIRDHFDVDDTSFSDAHFLRFKTDERKYQRSSGGTHGMEYFQLASVTAPREVPFNNTFTPGTALPSTE